MVILHIAMLTSLQFKKEQAITLAKMPLGKGKRNFHPLLQQNQKTLPADTVPAPMASSMMLPLPPKYVMPVTPDLLTMMGVGSADMLASYHILKKTVTVEQPPAAVAALLAPLAHFATHGPSKGIPRNSTMEVMDQLELINWLALQRTRITFVFLAIGIANRGCFFALISLMNDLSNWQKPLACTAPIGGSLSEFYKKPTRDSLNQLSILGIQNSYVAGKNDAIIQIDYGDIDFPPIL
uniref:Uncharacterized protein n=1 Tax=Romanomermis culicivorax TaxID=13658 RepID=A0A915J5S0_ROMCU